MATDLAEVMGASLGLYLLFGIPLFPAALIAGAGAFAILALQQRGFRRLEAVIAVMVGAVVGAFAFEVFYAHADGVQVARHLVLPGFSGTESVLLATGILGATVMPHVVYLHSALTQRRIVGRNDDERRRILRFEKVDVVLAMSLAGLVNIARGAIVDEAAMIDALREKRLGGAALDVFAKEPLPAESPLWSFDNVILAPHTSGDSPRVAERTLTLFAENLRRYKAGEPLLNRVDFAAGY